MVLSSIFSVTHLDNMNLLIITFLVYLICHAKNLIKMSNASDQMAKRALQHLQTVVNGLRSTSISTNVPDKSMKFYTELLFQAPSGVTDWFESCLSSKSRKSTIEQLYGFNFVGRRGVKQTVTVFLKANGFGAKILSQQDLVKRTLAHAAFQNLSFWQSTVSPAIADTATPEPVEGTLVSPEPVEGTLVLHEAAPDPSTAPEPPALTTITTPVEMEIDQQGKISNMYYCKFCIMDERNIILLHYILNLEIAKISNTYCSKFCIIAKRNILFLCYIFNLETARQVVVVEVQSREESAPLVRLETIIYNIYHYSLVFISTYCNTLLLSNSTLFYQSSTTCCEVTKVPSLLSKCFWTKNLFPVRTLYALLTSYSCIIAQPIS